LIFNIDSSIDDTEFPEDFKIFCFLENEVYGSIYHFRGEVLNQIISHKVVDDELIISEKFLDHVENNFGFFDKISIFVIGRVLFILFISFRRYDALDEIGENEHDPL
jgi:hypothetical protein